MAYGSCVPAVRDRLVTVLQARTGLSGVKVLRGIPRTEADAVSDDKTPETIWIGRGSGQDASGSADVPVLHGGALRFHEQVTVWLTVQVWSKQGNTYTPEEASDRAWTLAAEIVGAVADDATLGVPLDSQLIWFQVQGSYQFSETTRLLEAGGAATTLEVGLDCRARHNLTDL